MRGSTSVAVLRQVVTADEQIVVRVELPEFTVNNVEVLVGEVVVDAIDVVFLLEPIESLDQRRTDVRHGRHRSLPE